jgi:hypothetical protein
LTSNSSSAALSRGLRYLLPLLLYGALIFYGSSQSRWLLEPPDFFSADKIYHLLEYGIFGALTARAMDGYAFPAGGRRRILGIVAAGFLYGLSDEIHQYFVPGRFATLGDLLADTLGAGLGGWLFFRWPKAFGRLTNKGNADRKG